MTFNLGDDDINYLDPSRQPQKIQSLNGRLSQFEAIDIQVYRNLYRQTLSWVLQAGRVRVDLCSLSSHAYCFSHAETTKLSRCIVKYL